MVLIINFFNFFSIIIVVVVLFFYFLFFYNTVYCTNLLSVGQTQSVGGGIVSDDRCH